MFLAKVFKPFWSISRSASLIDCHPEESPNTAELEASWKDPLVVFNNAFVAPFPSSWNLEIRSRKEKINTELKKKN